MTAICRFRQSTHSTPPKAHSFKANFPIGVTWVIAANCAEVQTLLREQIFSFRHSRRENDHYFDWDQISTSTTRHSRAKSCTASQCKTKHQPAWANSLGCRSSTLFVTANQPLVRSTVPTIWDSNGTSRCERRFGRTLFMNATARLLFITLLCDGNTTLPPTTTRPCRWLPISSLIKNDRVYSLTTRINKKPVGVSQKVLNLPNNHFHLLHCFHFRATVSAFSARFHILQPASLDYSPQSPLRLAERIWNAISCHVVDATGPKGRRCILHYKKKYVRNRITHFYFYCQLWISKCVDIFGSLSCTFLGRTICGSYGTQHYVVLMQVA